MSSFFRFIRLPLAMVAAVLVPILLSVQAGSAGSSQPSAAPPPDDGKLRIIAFGAHPDDCEIRAGGVAAMWAAKGHHVKFVSCTNGDIGHSRMAGGPLAKRRLEEVQKAAKILGIHTEVMPIHDGELEPNLENRKTVTRLIRDWKADIVMSHRPNDYHPDHRYTGVLVQDAAYMVTVPFFVPESPHLRRDPVFLFYPDRFQKPNPFKADIVIAVDEAIEKKLDALDALESQFYEGGATGSPAPSEPAAQAQRRRDVREGFRRRTASVAAANRKLLADYYGAETGAATQYAEAFEICEYGVQPSKAEIARLFPFFGK